MVGEIQTYKGLFMLKKSMAILLTILLMMTNLSSINGGALREPPVSVRIGLVTYFEYVNNIHFYNSTVVPGFYEGGVFHPEVTIVRVWHDIHTQPAVFMT